VGRSRQIKRTVREVREIQAGGIGGGGGEKVPKVNCETVCLIELIYNKGKKRNSQTTERVQIEKSYWGELLPFSVREGV